MSSRLTVLGLLCFIVSLELVQIWIPGRFPGLRDVITGWGGVACAWLVLVVSGRLTGGGRRQASDTE